MFSFCSLQSAHIALSGENGLSSFSGDIDSVADESLMAGDNLSLTVAYSFQTNKTAALVEINHVLINHAKTWFDQHFTENFEKKTF